jgi:hypothetical protein
MFQDIGLDQDGNMEVLVERGTPLPHEMSCRIQLNGNTHLRLYEGNRFETLYNQQIGEYLVEKGTIHFSLHISDSYQMNVCIEDRQVDRLQCTKVEDPTPMEASRSWHHAKKEFIDYVESTLLFLEDPMTQTHVPEWKWAIEKLEWAKQIVDYPVTTEEYVVALQEIEHLINPVLNKSNQAIERKPL